MLTTEQRTKLPKWAVSHIEMLERNIESAERRIAELLPTEDTESPVTLDPYDRQIPLPPRDTYRFRMAGGGVLDVQRHVYNGGDGSELHISTNGGHPIVRPWAGNVILVGVRQD